MVAIVDPGDIAAGRLDQQGRLDHTTGHSLLHSEPRRVDDIEHLVIAREDLEHETLDSARGSTCRQLLEQTRANSDSLHLVGNGERDFGGGRIAQAVEARQSDHALTPSFAQHADQRPPGGPVGVEKRLDQPGSRPQTRVKALRHALRRERDQESRDRVSIAAVRRSEAERPTIPENHIREHAVETVNRHEPIRAP